MKKSTAAVAAAVAVLALGLLSGVALAGDHGNHGSPNSQKPESAQQGSTTTTSSDQQEDVKPSNDTHKDQTCTTGGGQGSSATCSSDTYPGKSDSSKRVRQRQDRGADREQQGRALGDPDLRAREQPAPQDLRPRRARVQGWRLLEAEIPENAAAYDRDDRHDHHGGSGAGQGARQGLHLPCDRLRDESVRAHPRERQRVGARSLASSGRP